VECLVARVVVVFGLSRLWPGDWREHANLPDRLGCVGLGDGGARAERGRGREIDGRATKGFERIVVEIDAKANRSLDEGKGKPIDSRRLF
jgi:hypothetical protein